MYNKKPYFCNKCHNGCIQPADLENHILKEHYGIEWCFRCNLVFSDWTDFHKHMLKKHNVKHICPYCPEAYNGLMYRRQKNDKTQYECIHCNEVYRTSKRLYNHLHVHDKPFICPCRKKKFNTIGSLRRHLINKHALIPCEWTPSFENIGHFENLM